MEPRNQEQFEISKRFARENENVHFIWLGGSDVLSEGSWLWDSDQSPINMTQFWADNQPSSSAENCIMMAYGGFHDLPCWQLRPFVCQLI